MIDLSKKPFYLSEKNIEKVYQIFNKMSEEERIGQLFCPVGTCFEESEIEHFIKKYKPGGMMYRSLEAKKIKKIHEKVQEVSNVPLLLAANLESGGNGICKDGTYVSRQMGIAATGNKEYAKHLGEISGKEANAVGCNWSFAPIVDIDINYNNPITNIRTYGSDINTIIDFAEKQIQGLQKNNVIPCIKHFPGDGVDDRDQHLVSSVNDLSVEKWEATFGKIYRYFISKGIQTMMIGHILLPNYEKEIHPTISDDKILPASLSKNVMHHLLRERLQFNGLIVSDATPMLGYTVAMPRSIAIPTSIEHGCDMILFNKNIDEDYEAVRSGLKNGLLSKQRLEQAVLRILATKMSNGLFEEVKPKYDLHVVGCKKHKQWAYQCATKAITLVKDKQNILPINIEKHKRIRLYNITDRMHGGFKEEGSTKNIKDNLEMLGFQVDEYNYQNLNFKEIFSYGALDMKEKYDLVIYMANFDTASNNTVRRIEWIKLMAADAPWFVKELPTIFISLANPYHLLDVPMIETYINCYSHTDETIDALVAKLIGKEPFVGVSPIDPYCGRWDTKR